MIKRSFGSVSLFFSAITVFIFVAGLGALQNEDWSAFGYFSAFVVTAGLAFALGAIGLFRYIETPDRTAALASMVLSTAMALYVISLFQ